MSVSIKNYFNKEKQQRVVSITNGKIIKEIPYNQYIKITDISNNTFEQSKKAIENYLLENE
jgi:uncharacterized protein (DUF427 family)